MTCFIIGGISSSRAVNAERINADFENFRFGAIGNLTTFGNSEFQNLNATLKNLNVTLTSLESITNSLFGMKTISTNYSSEFFKGAVLPYDSCEWPGYIRDPKISDEKALENNINIAELC